MPPIYQFSAINKPTLQFILIDTQSCHETFKLSLHRNSMIESKNCWKIITNWITLKTVIETFWLIFVADTADQGENIWFVIFLDWTQICPFWCGDAFWQKFCTVWSTNCRFYGEKTVVEMTNKGYTSSWSAGSCPLSLFFKHCPWFQLVESF